MGTKCIDLNLSPDDMLQNSESNMHPGTLFNVIHLFFAFHTNIFSMKWDILFCK